MYRSYGYRSNRCPSLEKLAELLVSRGTDVNLQGEFQCGTALQAALSKGHEEIVELLLSKGADVNA
jgi:ankyrin repeat protein